MGYSIFIHLKLYTKDGHNIGKKSTVTHGRKVEI